MLISFGTFFILKKVLIKDTREKLIQKTLLVEKQIIQTGEIPQLYPLIIVKQTSKTLNPEFRKIFIEDNIEKELNEYIQYNSTKKIKGVLYKISICQAVSENEDLILSIILSVSILLLIVLSMSFFITKSLNKVIWNEFENNLKQIENYSFENNNVLHLNDTKIDEFERLNNVLQKVIKKLSEEFESLKEFTANASHELQTPLSIISLNLEEILQNDLPKETTEIIYRTFKNVKKLSNLSKNLLLLAKVENNLFKIEEKLNINKIFENKLTEFESFFAKKNLTINKQFDSNYLINSNSFLLELLVENLLNNAIKHNVDNGLINININENGISICNTGVKNNLNNKDIFKRFTKYNSESFGLGLSIVKKICDVSGLKITYSQSNNIHCFKIKN